MNLAPWIVIISLWGFLAKRLKNNSNESQISHASIINTQFTAIPACNSSKEYEDALVLCSALDIYNRKFNGNSDPITAYTQFLRAETYQQKGDIELCHNEIQKGLKLSEACNEMQIYGKLHRVLAQVSLAQNKYDEAQKAIEIAKEKCQSGYNNDMQDEQNLIQSIYNQIQAAQNKS
jgi:tetratricopeptide (TPR) repeat protein